MAQYDYSVFHNDHEDERYFLDFEDAKDQAGKFYSDRFSDITIDQYYQDDELTGVYWTYNANGKLIRHGTGE